MDEVLQDTIEESETDVKILPPEELQKLIIKAPKFETISKHRASNNHNKRRTKKSKQDHRH